MTQASIMQINISAGGVPKEAIAEAIIGSLGVKGDRQSDTEHHGGPERALCLFSAERIKALQDEGHPILPGTVGENLTVTGLEWDDVVPGRRLRLGENVIIEITRYAQPCSHIRASFHDADSNRINQRTNPGWSRVYARVVTSGTIHPGDVVVLCTP